jgi:biotin operon repressor
MWKEEVKKKDLNKRIRELQVQGCTVKVSYEKGKYFLEVTDGDE